MAIDPQYFPDGHLRQEDPEFTADWDTPLAQFLAERVKKMTAKDLHRLGNIALKAAELLHEKERNRKADINF